MFLNKEVSLSLLDVRFFWNLDTTATQVEVTVSEVAHLL